MVRIEAFGFHRPCASCGPTDQVKPMPRWLWVFLKETLQLGRCTKASSYLLASDVTVLKSRIVKCGAVVVVSIPHWQRRWYAPPLKNSNKAPPTRRRSVGLYSRCSTVFSTQVDALFLRAKRALGKLRRKTVPNTGKFGIGRIIIVFHIRIAARSFPNHSKRPPGISLILICNTPIADGQKVLWEPSGYWTHQNFFGGNS